MISVYLFQAIHDHLFEYETNEDDFNACDLNGDGLLEVDEVVQSIFAEGAAGRKWTLREFSNNGDCCNFDMNLICITLMILFSSPC